MATVPRVGLWWGEGLFWQEPEDGGERVFFLLNL